MIYKTLTEACHAWVNEFNAVPVSVLNKLYGYNPFDFTEITPPVVGDRVYVDKKSEYGEIIKANPSKGDYFVELDNGKKTHCSKDDIYVIYDDTFPMWGTLWQFNDSCDDEWANGKYLGPHLQEMADCGFRIYENEDYGLLFGIDGAGYDFFESHWIPLYKARGLQWHKKDDTEKKTA